MILKAKCLFALFSVRVTKNSTIGGGPNGGEINYGIALILDILPKNGYGLSIIRRHQSLETMQLIIITILNVSVS